MNTEFYNEIVQDIKNYQGKKQDFKAQTDALYNQAKDYFDNTYQPIYEVCFDEFIKNPHGYVQYAELIDFYAAYSNEVRQIGIALSENAVFLIIDNKYLKRTIFGEDMIRDISGDILYDNWTYAYELSNLKKLDTEIGYFEWDINIPKELEKQNKHIQDMITQYTTIPVREKFLFKG